MTINKLIKASRDFIEELTGSYVVVRRLHKVTDLTPIIFIIPAKFMPALKAYMLVNGHTNYRVLPSENIAMPLVGRFVYVSTVGIKNNQINTWELER